MARNKAASQRNNPGRIPVSNATTRLTGVTMGTRWLRGHPLPMPFLIRRTADWADRRFRQF